MSTQYCTTSDVRAVIRTFAGDIDDNNLGYATISSDDISDAIDQATVITQYDLLPRFSIAVINALSPDYPLPVSYVTALRAAELVYNRIGTVSVERNSQLKGLFQTEIARWQRAIAAGTLYDVNGELVPNLAGPALFTQTYVNEINDIYLLGPRRYV